MNAPVEPTTVERRGGDPGRVTDGAPTCGLCGASLRLSYPRSGTAAFCPDCDALVRPRRE